MTRWLVKVAEVSLFDGYFFLEIFPFPDFGCWCIYTAKTLMVCLRVREPLILEPLADACNQNSDTIEQLI